MKLYHTKTLSLPWELDKLNFPSDYNKVADIKALTLDELWELANSISNSWTLNPGVKAISNRLRSMVIGDVIEDDDGKLWRCESLGWKEIFMIVKGSASPPSDEDNEDEVSAESFEPLCKN